MKDLRKHQPKRIDGKSQPDLHVTSFSGRRERDDGRVSTETQI